MTGKPCLVKKLTLYTIWKIISQSFVFMVIFIFYKNAVYSSVGITIVSSTYLFCSMTMHNSTNGAQQCMFTDCFSICLLFFFFSLLPLSLRHFRRMSPSVLIRTRAVSDVEAGSRVKTSVSLQRAVFC